MNDSPLDALAPQGRTLSATHDRFLRWVAETPAARNPAAYAAIAGPLPSYHGHFQAWPAFVRRRDSDALSRVVATLIRTMLATPSCARDIEEDPDAVRAFELLAARDPQGDTVFARGEFVERAEGFGCVEVNVSGALAAWVHGQVGRQMMDLEVLRPFLATVDAPSICNPAVSAMRKVFELTPDDATIVAMVANDWSDERVALAETILNALGAQTGQARTVVARRPSALHYRGGRVVADGIDVPVVAVLNAQFPFDVGPEVAAAVEDPRCAWFSGPAARVLCDKRAFARAAELLEQRDDEDARFARGFVPWTRCVAPGPVVYRGHEVRIEDLLANGRERLVTKPGPGYHGADVVIGRATDEATWEGAVRAALAGGKAVVQEFMEPVLRPHLARDGRVFSGRCIWGAFAVGRDNGGLHYRVSETDLNINAARGAENGIVVFVDE